MYGDTYESDYIWDIVTNRKGIISSKYHPGNTLRKWLYTKKNNWYKLNTVIVRIIFPCEQCSTSLYHSIILVGGLGILGGVPYWITIIPNILGSIILQLIINQHPCPRLSTGCRWSVDCRRKKHESLGITLLENILKPSTSHVYRIFPC